MQQYNSFQSFSPIYYGHIFYIYMHNKPHNAMLTFLKLWIVFQEIKKKMYFYSHIYHFWCSLSLPANPSFRKEFTSFHVLSVWKTYFSISYNAFLLATDYLSFSLSENFNQLKKILSRLDHNHWKIIVHCSRDIYFSQNIHNLFTFLSPLPLGRS